MHADVVGPPSGARPRPRQGDVPRPARWLGLSLIALALAWLPVKAAAEGERLTALKDLPAAPRLALPDLSGRLWRLDELRGKVVLVNFWATWCPPCRREIPSLVRLATALKDLDFIVLAVNSGESREVVQDFVSHFGLQAPFPFLLDEANQSARSWPMKGLPTTFVVDRQGRIALHAAGGREFDHPDVEQAIRELIGAPP
jgi:thiol-disulfide isomerase/thioredoxin